MNILITGSAGFIGYHLVNQLLKTNHKIYGCDSLISKSVKTQKKRLKLLKKSKKFEFKKLDLRNYTKFCHHYKKKKNKFNHTFSCTTWSEIITRKSIKHN